MKKLHSGHALLFFGLFLAILFFIFFLSCASPKEILRETATTATTIPADEPERIPLTQLLIKNWIQDSIEKILVFSGPDTIKISPKQTLEVSYEQEGGVVFVNKLPTIILPFTPGVVIGLVLNEKTK